MNIEAISVFLKIDGRVVLAPIASKSAQLFVGMLPAFQEGQPKQAKMYVMPPEVTVHIENAGRALGGVMEKKRDDAGKAGESKK